MGLSAKRMLGRVPDTHSFHHLSNLDDTFRSADALCERRDFARAERGPLTARFRNERPIWMLQSQHIIQGAIFLGESDRQRLITAL